MTSTARVERGGRGEDALLAALGEPPPAPEAPKPLRRNAPPKAPPTRLPDKVLTRYPGAHILPVNNQKRPCNTDGTFRNKWQKTPATGAEILRWQANKGRCGVIPASLGLTIIDVDLHDPTITPAERDALLPAMAALAREALGQPLGEWRTPEGHHLAYPCVPEHGKSEWLHGQVITGCGDKGFQVVIHDAMALLASVDALTPDAVPPDLSFLPVQEAIPLTEADTSEGTPSPAPGKDTPPAKGEKPKATPKPRQTPEVLAGLCEGKRNNYLNDGVFLDARDRLLTPERETEWRDAALASGLTLSEADATIRSATEAGRKADDGFVRENKKIIPRHQGNITRALEKLNVRLSYDQFSQKTIVSFEGFTGPYQDKQRNRIWLTIDKRFHFRLS